jgi:density-regulated protein DRP1
MAMAYDESKFLQYSGPTPGVKYPLNIIYCPPDICDGWPLEYCEFHPNYEKAKEWMDKNLTDDMRDLYLGENENGAEGEGGAEGEKKKRQTRGGRGVVKLKQKQDIEKRISLSRACRGKRKFVTVVTGLSTYEIDLKVASKFFGGRFACGSSVTGDDEIVIQGDVKDDLLDVLIEKWPQIDEDSVEDLGDQKRA